MDAAQVGLFLELINRLPQAGIEDIAEVLMAHGMTREDAECLIAFVPMAFAHAFLVPAGVRLPGTYLLQGQDSDERLQGQLAEEPALREDDALKFQRITGQLKRHRILGAERRNGQHIRSIPLRQPLFGQAMRGHKRVLMRLPIEHLKRKRKSWLPRLLD